MTVISSRRGSLIAGQCSSAAANILVTAKPGINPAVPTVGALSSFPISARLATWLHVNLSVLLRRKVKPASTENAGFYCALGD